MRRMRTFLKIWTKSMKRSREWAMKSLSPFLAFLMITWVSNMTNPQKMASPMYRWAWRNWFKSLCRCKHLHLQGYLEKQLGPKEDVKETEEEEGGEAREEGATKVEVLAIWSKESCPGKAGKDGGGKHESWELRNYSCEHFIRFKEKSMISFSMSTGYLEGYIGSLFLLQ